MIWRIVEASRVAATPWRNGGGLTRQLLRVPLDGATANEDDWVVRISLADITADGPFSPFPGIERWFTVLAGAGVVLVWGSAEARVMTPGSDPLRFDGDDPPGCRLLDGPTRDLNVMVRRDFGHARLEPARWDAAWNPGTAFWAGVFARCPLELRAGPGPRRMLPVHTVAGCERPLAGPWTIAPAATAGSPKAQTEGPVATPAWWIAVSAPRPAGPTSPPPSEP